MSQRADQVLRRRLGVQVGIGLVLVAILSVLSHAGSNRLLASLETDTPSLAATERQQMLSQRVSLLALRYVSTPDATERARVGGLLDAAIVSMAEAHDTVLSEQVPRSPGAVDPVRELYLGSHRLDLRVADYLGWARAVRRLPETELRGDHPLVRRMLVESERPLLRDLRRATTYVEEASAARVEGGQRGQVGLLLATLALVLAEAVFLFWPLVHRLVRQDARRREHVAALRGAIEDVAAAAERDHVEHDEILVHVLGRPAAFQSFWADTVQNLALARGAPEDDELLERLHLIEDQTAVFGFRTLSGQVSRLACAIVEDGDTTVDVDGALQAIQERFTEDLARALPHLGERSEEVTLSLGEYEAHLAGLRSALPHRDLLDEAERWPWEPARLRLEACAEEARRIASRLGRSVKIEIDGASSRMPDGPLWGAVTRMLRRAVEHGIEDEGTRRAAGKPRRAALTLACASDDRTVCVTLADDGLGIVVVDGPTRSALDELLEAGGAAEIVALPGRGVRVELSMPLARASTSPPQGSQGIALPEADLPGA